VLFGTSKPHCAQRNQEPIAYFLLVPAINGDRRSIGGIISARLALSGTALPLDGGEPV
jgi:hypothetical protein